MIILHALGVPGLKRALILLSLSAFGGLLCLSCSNSSNNSTPTITSRAFVSQDVNGGGVAAGLLVVDADRDVRAFQSPITAGITPGLMVVTPNHVQTLAFSATGNTLSLVSNAQESALASVSLPGFTESIVVSPDSQTAYVAIPTAPLVGKPPGAIVIINLNSGAVTAQLSVPAVRYLSIANNGNRVLAFSDNSDSVTVIDPSKITSGNPTTVVGGFDRPVQGFFVSNDTSAFIVNCGAECGGAQSGVQPLDLTSDPPVAGVAASVPGGATVALINGSTMYLAGSMPPVDCSTPNNSISCGQLTVFDLSTMSVLNTAPILIPDGYHSRIALGANGKLFVGSRTCDEVLSGDEQRGCLAIFDTGPAGSVVVPPANGDVTGIQPIVKRAVVYVVQGGELEIYDTTTDKITDKQINISGEAVDVKTIDF